MTGGQDLTVSGLSSGGYMTSLLTTIYSGRVRASANFAGGIYYCSKGDIMKYINA